MYSPTTSPYGYSSFPKEENSRYCRFALAAIKQGLLCHKCATLLARLCQRTGTVVPKAWQGRANTLAQGQQDNFEKQARLLRRTSVESSHFTSQSKAFRVLFCTSLVHSCSFFSFQSFTFASNNSSLKNQLHEKRITYTSAIARHRNVVRM